jgi:hypothetical protein
MSSLMCLIQVQVEGPIKLSLYQCFLDPLYFVKAIPVPIAVGFTLLVVTPVKVTDGIFFI